MDETVVCFTWDDNLGCHSAVTAPLFEKRGLRCSFYLNPGEDGFDEVRDGLKPFCLRGFEMGSHGYRHINFNNVSIEEFRRDIEASVRAMTEAFGVKPVTYAFPYHIYDEERLSAAREYFLETRNTLCNSVRVDIRTALSAGELLRLVEENRGKTVVFAGHGVAEKDPAGYEPMYASVLEKVLDGLLEMEGVKVMTLSACVGGTRTVPPADTPSASGADAYGR